MLLYTIFAMFVTAQQCSKVTVRKEVNDLTDAEWDTFISTIQQAQTQRDPNTGLTLWEQAADLHNSLSGSIHWNCVFFFWHRLFLQQMEQKLQEINPNFFFPYWDSSREWDRADESIVFQRVGRNGMPVSNDIFNGAALIGSKNTPLRRDYSSLNGKLVALETYNDLFTQSLTNGGFEKWSQDAELSHGVLHISVAGVDGQMKTMWSPLDPIFYMHHGHMDYLWMQAQAGWKSANLGDGAQYGGKPIAGEVCGPDTELPGYSNKLSDVVEIRSLCVVYANPGQIVTPESTVPTTQNPTTTTRATTTTTARTTTTTTTRAITTTNARTTTTTTTTSVAGNPFTTSIVTIFNGNANLGGWVDETITMETTSQSAKETTVARTTVETTRGTSTGLTTSKPTPYRTTSTNMFGTLTKTATNSYATSSRGSYSTNTGNPARNPTSTAQHTIDYGNTYSSMENHSTIGTNTQLPPTISPTYALPTQVPVYNYPTGYKKIDRCPPPLPDSWLRMARNGSSIEEDQNRMYNACLSLVERVKNGEDIRPMPLFDPQDRPDIVHEAPRGVVAAPKPGYVFSSSKRATTSVFLLALMFLI